jgi:hypothetical protein
MATTSKMGTKHKPLSISEKFNIINKEDWLQNVLTQKLQNNSGNLHINRLAGVVQLPSLCLSHYACEG